ncbi:hypothetical protein LUZ60_001200 [Juncus effusus]|nr:hypothetical protein LUZ60_001200 [Juncus effusus]
MRALCLALFLIQAILFTFLCLVPTASCMSRLLISPHQEKGMLMEDKTRLGSTPPNCHNRCSLCNPCFPVQVPALVVQAKQVFKEREEQINGDTFSFLESSNYKPMGWKCQCHDQLYNP